MRFIISDRNYEIVFQKGYIYLYTLVSVNAYFSILAPAVVLSNFSQSDK